jgi:hypothetical protein
MEGKEKRAEQNSDRREITRSSTDDSLAGFSINEELVEINTKLENWLDPRPKAASRTRQKGAEENATDRLSRLL